MARPIALRVSTEMICQILRLDSLDASIVSATFDPASPSVVFYIHTPAAPDNATGMTPVYSTEYPSGRYFMTDPGWETPTPDTPASTP